MNCLWARTIVDFRTGLCDKDHCGGADGKIVERNLPLVLPHCVTGHGISLRLPDSR
jgi:hypothetical protein